MDRQTTGLMFSYYNKSQYHERCIPAKDRVAAEPTPTSTVTQTKVDPIVAEQQWKQAVDREWSAVRQWERNWGFLTDYDTKGEIREKTPVPENQTRFSETIPNTNAGNYGNQLKSEEGQRILSLEKKFFSEKRKKKMDADIVCY